MRIGVPTRGHGYSNDRARPGTVARRLRIDSFAMVLGVREVVVFRDLCMGFGFVWLYNPVSMIGPVRISVWGLDFFGFSILGMDF